jgi:hypothetical protein
MGTIVKFTRILYEFSLKFRFCKRVNTIYSDYIKGWVDSSYYNNILLTLNNK